MSVGGGLLLLFNCPHATVLSARLSNSAVVAHVCVQVVQELIDGV
jgi:hypothetical protein